MFKNFCFFLHMQKELQFATVKLRRDGYQALKELCGAAGVKLADAVKLWPKCPRCGSLLAEVGGVITCVKCRNAYRLQ